VQRAFPLGVTPSVPRRDEGRFRLSRLLFVPDQVSPGSIFPERGAQWSCMSNRTEIPPLPPELMAAVEEEARAQARPVGDLLADAVRKYLEDRSWHKTIVSARERSKSMGLTEVDVGRLIAESRSEQSG
jgi:hypothetical protein